MNNFVYECQGCLENYDCGVGEEEGFCREDVDSNGPTMICFCQDEECNTRDLLKKLSQTSSAYKVSFSESMLIFCAIKFQ